MSERMIKLDPPGSVRATGPKRRAERFALDYATWRAHLAAPGSRFEPTQAAMPPIVRLDAVSRVAGSVEAERKTA
jgi:hypothetical protein